MVSKTLFPVAASHKTIAPSEPPLTINFPSELHARAVTSFESASHVAFSCPVAASHIFTVLSDEPVAIFFPSGLQTTAFTAFVCCLKVNKEVPETPSHIFCSIIF